MLSVTKTREKSRLSFPLIPMAFLQLLALLLPINFFQSGAFKMRFNVYHNGNRTTARVSDDLWELFIDAHGRDRQAALMAVNECIRGWYGLTFKNTPAYLIESYFMRVIRNSMLPPIAFNRDPKQHESGVRNGRQD